MRYAFMSFSLPEASLRQFLGAAAEYGYDGVEPRIGAGHQHGIELAASAADRREIRELAGELGVAVACVATSCRFADPANAQAAANEARGAIELAADLDSHRIRVFGGAFPDTMSRADAIDHLSASLAALADDAASHDVVVCLETHDAWTSPDDVAEVMRRVDHPAVAVNWDVMHPLRINGRTVEEAHAVLRPWVRHVHVHDSDISPDSLQFRPMGTGAIDHRAVLALLRADGYDGYLSGEWINWEPGETHLPREIAALREFEAALTA